ncbi:MAG: tyrosine-type recombinase/integrase [Treponema sp.]|nr:tyrosine-type recombinase/integrase [Treponema sp.]
MRMKGHEYPSKYLAGRQGHLDVYVIPSFGSCKPEELKRRDIDQWLLYLKKPDGKPLAGSTKNKIMYTMSLIFEELRDMEVLEKNPITGIRAFNKKPVRPRGVIDKIYMEKLFPESFDGLMQIWNSAMWAALMLVLKDTGSRPGEVRALTWGDIDFCKRFIPFRKGVASGTTDRIKETKTGTVKAGFLTMRTIDTLKMWKRQSLYTEETGFVFTIDGKRPVSAVAVIRAFRRGMDNINASDKSWTPYWLRHSFGTYQMQNLSQEEIMKLMGHKAEAITRIYQHPDNEILYRSAEDIKKKLDKSRE